MGGASSYLEEKKKRKRRSRKKASAWGRGEGRNESFISVSSRRGGEHPEALYQPAKRREKELEFCSEKKRKMLAHLFVHGERANQLNSAAKKWKGKKGLKKKSVAEGGKKEGYCLLDVEGTEV